MRNINTLSKANEIEFRKHLYMQVNRRLYDLNKERNTAEKLVVINKAHYDQAVTKQLENIKKETEFLKALAKQYIRSQIQNLKNNTLYKVLFFKHIYLLLEKN